MKNDDKNKTLEQIKAGVEEFSRQYLNDELRDYALRLCDKLGRKRTLSITSGKKEVWQAAIIYVIARLNFLFDASHPNHVTADDICGFFGVKKSTASQKATLIEKSCNIRMGEPELSNSEITDMLTIVKLPGGFVMPLGMFKKQMAEPEIEHEALNKKKLVYTLEVFIINGMVTEAFLKKNSVMARTIEILEDQTLEDLHNAIFKAFDREDQHIYEFQFGEGPHEPNGKRYVLPSMMEVETGKKNIAGYVAKTTIGKLRLEVNQAFGYWFDFGDDWMHQINVVSIRECADEGPYPRVTAREGQSPPQYPDFDE